MKKPRSENQIRAQKENLKPLKKGQVNNPNGRKQGSFNRRTIVRKFLEAELYGEPLPWNLKGVATVADTLVLAMIKKAKNGDVAAYKELMDTAFGKVPDITELTGANGEPLIPIIVDDIRRK